MKNGRCCLKSWFCWKLRQLLVSRIQIFGILWKPKKVFAYKFVLHKYFCNKVNRHASRSISRVSALIFEPRWCKDKCNFMFNRAKRNFEVTRGKTSRRIKVSNFARIGRRNLICLFVSLGQSLWKIVNLLSHFYLQAPAFPFITSDLNFSAFRAEKESFREINIVQDHNKVSKYAHEMK